jgi:phosphonate transport system substrate-binding protein
MPAKAPGRYRGLWPLIVFLLFAGACSSAGDPAQGAEDGSTVRIAVTDLQGLEELQREFGAFVAAFEESTGLSVEFYPVNDRVAAAAALQSEQVDLVFTGPAEYVVLRERVGVEPVVAIKRDNYHSCIYSPADSGIDSVAELKGKTVGMSDIGSTSGHLGPSQLLVDAGLDPRADVKVLTVGDAVHEALKRGDIDAVGIGCHDYEEFMEADDPARYKMLKEGEELPPDIVVAREGYSPETIERIQAAFEDDFDTLLAALLEGKDYQKYDGATLVIPDDSDYDVVRSMYQAIGVDDFTEFVGD